VAGAEQVEEVSTVGAGQVGRAGTAPVGVIGANGLGLLQVLHAQFRSPAGAEVFLLNSARRPLEWAVERGLVAAERAIWSSDASLATVPALAAVWLCVPPAQLAEALQTAAMCAAPGAKIVWTWGRIEPEQLGRLAGGSGEVRSAGRVTSVSGAVHQPLVVAGKPVRVVSGIRPGLEDLRAAVLLLSSRVTRFAAVISHRLSAQATVELMRCYARGEDLDLAGMPVVCPVLDQTLTGEAVQIMAPW
jgi:hypothetical protein